MGNSPLPPSERVSCARRLPIGESSKPLPFLTQTMPKMIAMVLPHSWTEPSSFQTESSSSNRHVFRMGLTRSTNGANPGSPLTMTWYCRGGCCCCVPPKAPEKAPTNKHRATSPAVRYALLLNIGDSSFGPLGPGYFQYKPRA